MPKRHFTLTRLLTTVVLTLLVLTAFAAGAVAYWLRAPLILPAEKVDFVIDPGSSMRSIARQLQEAGIAVYPDALVALARVTGDDRKVKAGGYEITRGDSLQVLLNRLTRGDVTQREVRFIEGWNFRQVRAALARHPDISQTLGTLDETALLAAIGTSATHPEGLFFPDTYLFSVGSTDVEILRRAYRAQQDELQHMWEKRAPDLPLNTPYEALILASIIEKETGHEAERARISGVFINRLRIGMPLQTDPTVIYGLGETFDGDLRRRDLRADTPWNTYTRRGLPPTPISAPGRASLMAALQPENHKFLYFVSRGNGTSEFTSNLADHNRAVARYQLGRGQNK